MCPLEDPTFAVVWDETGTGIAKNELDDLKFKSLEPCANDGLLPEWEIMLATEFDVDTGTDPGMIRVTLPCLPLEDPEREMGREVELRRLELECLL